MHVPPWLRPSQRNRFLPPPPRHITSLITQLRTGKIGLNAFLHQRHVPGYDSALCRCESGPEDIYYMLLDCPIWRDRPAPDTPPLRTKKDVMLALDNPNEATQIAQWVVNLGRLTYMKNWAWDGQDTDPCRARHGQHTNTNSEQRTHFILCEALRPLGDQAPSARTRAGHNTD